LYEDYFVAMLVATVLMMFSPIIRIATESIRAYLFDFGEEDADS